MADSGGSGSGGGGPSTTTGEVASAASASGGAFDPRNDPDCMQGMLYKKGRLRWAKRWVVLHDRVLFSYSSKTDTKSPERIPVVGYSVRTADEDSKRPFSFSLSHSGVRTMYWAAEDYGTLSAWLVVLFKATQNEDSKPHNPRQLSNMRSASIDDHPALRNSRLEARPSPLASAPDPVDDEADPVDDEDGEPSDDGVHSDDLGTRRASNAGAARRSMKRSASSGLGLKEAQAAADRQRQLTARKGASRSIKASDGRPDSGFRSNLNNILAMPGARPPLTRGVVRAGDGEAPPPKSQKPVRRPSGKTLPETTHAGPAPPGTMSEAPVVWSSSDDEAGHDAEEWADPEEGPVDDDSPTGDGDRGGGGDDDGGDDEEPAPALPPRNNLPSVQAADQRLRNRTLTSEATTAAAKPSKGKPPPPSGGPPAKPQMPSRPSPKHMPAKLQRRRKTPSGRSVAVTETGDSDGEDGVASDDASSSVGIDTRPQGLRDSFKHNVAASLERQLAGAPPPKTGRPRPTVRPARATLQQSVSSERSDDQDDTGAEPAVDSNDYSDDDGGGDDGAAPVVDAAGDNDASEAATTAETSDPHAAPSTGGGDGRTRAERLLALKKLTLTAWINSHSRARAHIVSDLGEAVRGGVTLVLLAEVLTENICRGTRVPPRGEEAVLDNTRAAISLLKQTGWESDMSAADVVAASDHDACTFVYSLFVHFETRGKIRVGGARAARFSLPISPPADKIMPMADIVGVLYKLGGALGKKWQERSFILFGGILYYYKRGDTQAPAGTIILPSYVVEDWEHKKKAHAFCLSHTGCKTYYLAANSAAEKDRWISALSQAAAGRPVVLP